MKTNFRIFTLVLLTAVMVSCRDQFTEVFTANSPIYMSYDELRAAVKPAAPRDLENPGKIYFKDDYIFVVEEMKGFHLIDVSNPASPQKKAFVQIPGCVDIAVKENILYADSYVDMVAIDVSDINNMKEIKRVRMYFRIRFPLPGMNTALPKWIRRKGWSSIGKSKRYVRRWNTSIIPSIRYFIADMPKNWTALIIQLLPASPTPPEWGDHQAPLSAWVVPWPVSDFTRSISIPSTTETSICSM